MIKFFRKIRQDLLSTGETGKYLKYAIGEIFLVVIGILIALQINNWNEIKKLRKVEHQYYTDILEDLKKDTIDLRVLIEHMQKDIKAIEVAFQTLDLPDLTDDQIDSIISKTEYRVLEFIPSTITMDDIISSGKTGILNAELKRELFVLSNRQERLEVLQNVNNEDVVWHIKQYETLSDYSYPKLKKNRNEKTERFNPLLLKKYTNVLAKKYEKSVDHKNLYEMLLEKTSNLITMLEEQISKEF